MKWNWGTGITLAIVSFMAFILFLVFQTYLTHNDLYADDYYQQELDYQEQIDRISNTRPFEKDCRVESLKEALVLTLPQSISSDETQGSVEFYRASDASLDLNFPLSIKGHQQSFEYHHFTRGRYTLKVIWEYANVPYYLEKEIFIP